METRTTLPPDSRSARVARRFVEAALQAWGHPHLVDPLTLLASELVTNAVVHAGSSLEMTVRGAAGCWRVEVADRSPLPPRRRLAADDATTGRGLVLVEALADRWGFEGRETGKTVWFELDDRSPHGQSAAAGAGGAQTVLA